MRFEALIASHSLRELQPAATAFAGARDHMIDRQAIGAAQDPFKFERHGQRHEVGLAAVQAGSNSTRLYRIIASDRSNQHIGVERDHDLATKRAGSSASSYSFGP